MTHSNRSPIFIILSNERKATITKYCNDSWSSLASSNFNRIFLLLSEVIIGYPWLPFAKKLLSKQGGYFSSNSTVSPERLKHIELTCVIFQTTAWCLEPLAAELCLKSICMVETPGFIVQQCMAPCHHRKGQFQE